jgi:hypothetical protein
MKCTRVQSFFDQMYREGDRFEHPDIVAHVKQCPTCLRNYEQWCGIAREFGTAPVLDPPPELYGKVMRAVEEHNAGASGLWWPVHCKTLSYSALSFAVLLIVAVTFFGGTPQIPDRTMPANALASKALSTYIPVHFEISITNARQVALVGDFNSWDKEKNILTKTEPTTWAIDLPLPKGSYQYLFLIDGKEWRNDPTGATNIPDGFGGYNSVMEL